MVAITVVLAAGLWAVTLVRWRTPNQSLLKPAFDDTGPTDAHNLRCIWITAIVATLYVRPVSEFVDGWTRVPGLAGALMFSLLVLGSAELLMALRAITLPPNRAQAGSWRRGAAVGVVVAGLLTAVLIGQPGHSDVSVRWDQPAWMAVFWAMWLGWCLAASGQAAFTATRFVRSMGPSRLRTSIGFLAFGAVALGMYAVVKATAIATTVRGGQPHAATAWLILAAVTVMAVSAAASSSWTAVSHRLERTRSVRMLRSVERLWSRLSVVDPGLALDPFPRDIAALSRHESKLALYRASIEIRDWMRLLGDRLPPGAWTTAWDAVADIPEPQRSWRATAGWVAAGLASNECLDGDTSPVPPIGGDVDEMERFLQGVGSVPDAEAAMVAERIGKTTWETTR